MLHRMKKGTIRDRWEEANFRAFQDRKRAKAGSP
jgi:hypothetical protein